MKFTNPFVKTVILFALTAVFLIAGSTVSTKIFATSMAESPQNTPAPSNISLMNIYQPGTPDSSLSEFPFSENTLLGTEQQITLSIGETYPLSNTVFIRLDTISEYTQQITMWTEDERGCRFIRDWISTYKGAGNEEQRYTFLADWLIRIDTISDNEISLAILTGDKAREACLTAGLQKHRCLSYKANHSFTAISTNFSRNFSESSSYPYNNLMLNYTEQAYSKLKTIFPSLALAKPVNNTWKFYSNVSDSEFTDSAWPDTATITVAPNSIQEMISDDNSLLQTYQTKLASNNLFFDFSTEIHELTHLFLFSTELNIIPNPTGETTKLAEGIADYIQAVARHYPDKRDIKQNFCGKTQFIGGPINVLDGMSYIDAFDQGYNYDTGICFFTEVERVCGLQTIDNLFLTLLQHQYEPFVEYPSMFKVMHDKCTDPSAFGEIMTNFGFSPNLLEQQYSIAPYTPIQTSACQ